MPELTPEMIAACGRCAEKFGVSEKLHPDDFLFWAIEEITKPADKSVVVEEYFSGGHIAAHMIKGIVDQFPSLPRPFSFLDFASGYGRVSRHLKNVIPDALVTACDIHPAAVEFIRSINIPAVPSARVPEEFDPERGFDVICAISFFTHLPRETWGRWLRSVCRFLKSGGVLIFTTHGRAAIPIPAMKAMSITSQSVPEDGFLYLPVSDQTDLSLYDYGTAITLFEFVFRETLDADLRIVWFQEAAAGYQDLVVVTQGDQNLSSFRTSMERRIFRLLPRLRPRRH
jgi:SAM-dependent methyltransferase